MYAGLDLKVGGEWLKALYDQIIPQFLNNYTKKWGGRVGTTEIGNVREAYSVVRADTGTEVISGAVYNRLDAGTEISRLQRLNRSVRFRMVPHRNTVHSLDLTPAMKREVLYKGQPRGFVRLPSDEPTARKSAQAAAVSAAATAQKIPVTYVGKQETGGTGLEPFHLVNEPSGTTVEFNPAKHLITGAKPGVAIPPELQAPTPIPPTGGTPERVARVIDALKTSKPIREQQEALYTKARQEKIARVLAIRERVGGEAGLKAELGALKGELPKAQFESLRGRVSPEDFDALLDDLNRAVEIGDWEKVTAKVGLAKLFGQFGGEVPTRGELSLLSKVFGPDLSREVLRHRSGAQKMGSAALELIGSTKTFRSTLDLSAALRQGVVFVGRPNLWMPAFKDMFKFFGREKALTALYADIRSRPTYRLMQESRLPLTEVDAGFTAAEEQFMFKNFAEKIPVYGRAVRASNRAYTGFLNKLRADAFDFFYQQGKALGGDVDNPGYLRKLGGFLGAATGRGELPAALEKSAVALNALFFSPRLMAARLALLNPTTYITLPPVLRRQAIETLIRFVGVGTAVLTLAKLGGAKVGGDPRSADFGKIKVGKTRYDIWGGFQQYIRGAAQFLTGTHISTITGRETKLGEGYKPTTRWDIVVRFLESKEAPLVSLLTTILHQRTPMGDPVHISAETIELFIPLFVGDLVEMISDYGSLGAVMSLPTIFGVGVQHYGEAVPQLTKTSSGQEKIGFRQPPSVGERLINAITGTQVSNIPKSLHPALQKARMQEMTHKVEVDKAKRLTLEDGRRRRVGATEVYLDRGVVKTLTPKGVKTTPLKVYQQRQAQRRIRWDEEPVPLR